MVVGKGESEGKASRRGQRDAVIHQAALRSRQHESANVARSTLGNNRGFPESHVQHIRGFFSSLALNVNIVNRESGIVNRKSKILFLTASQAGRGLSWIVTGRESHSQVLDFWVKNSTHFVIASNNHE